MIIAIDHGYYVIKTKHFSFPAGITAYSHEPFTKQGVLQYGEKYYVCGTGRQPIQRTKTETENYYLLTLAAIARKIKYHKGYHVLLEKPMSTSAAGCAELGRLAKQYDIRIVAFAVSDRNDNPLVFKALDRAVAANPNAHPLFHSDRGFQYTNRAFPHKMGQAGMVQSMSRVAHYIDIGPMEGFWGILKRERYYDRRFTSKQELISMIHCYISYYNNRRVQRNLGVLTP